MAGAYHRHARDAPAGTLDAPARSALEAPRLREDPMAADSPIDHEPIDYTLGSMDITEQKATFNVIMRLVKWVSLGIAALLLMLTIWFGTEWGNFLNSLMCAVALLVIGVFALKAKNESDRPH